MKLILLLLLLLVPLLNHAQLGSEHKGRRVRSAQQIIDLKDGVIFFRLKTRDRQIEYLRKYNNHTEADKIERKQNELNQKIVDAFTKNFAFCPVYFFYSKDSKYIRLGQFDSVTFLNPSLQADSSIHPIPDYYCTAELGTVVSDTAKYFTGNVVVEGENGLEERPTYATGPDAGFKALVIMSDQFIQLVHPFPYYRRTYRANPSRKLMYKAATELSFNLNAYYSKVIKNSEKE